MVRDAAAGFQRTQDEISQLSAGMHAGPQAKEGANAGLVLIQRAPAYTYGVLVCHPSLAAIALRERG